MNRKLLIGAGLLAVMAFLTVAYVLRPPEEAGTPIEAVPLVIGSATTAAEPSANSTEDAVTVEETAPTSEETGVTTGSEFQAAGLVVFAISQDESEVRFSVDEILNSTPTTAVGVTNQIAGEIAVGFDDPSATQVGVITINARTLTTDRSNRNRMIQNEILDTAPYEFITFTPTEITGLPDSILPGETVTFMIVGDLTIRDVTQSIAFEVTASVSADGRLEGHAVATVLRSDYDLTIPSVPSVAEVSNEVLLEIDFVAFVK